MTWHDVASLLLIFTAVGIWGALLWALPRMNWPVVNDTKEPRRTRNRGPLRVVAKTEEQERQLEEDRDNDPQAS